MKKHGSKIIVFYDGWCPLCIKVKNNIKKIDFFNNIEMVNIREPGIERYGIPLSSLEKHMHAKIIRNNKIVLGIFAFMAIASNVPLLMPLWPLLKLSQMIGLGQRVYDFIAKNRIIIPVGNCERNSCNINE
ncbi:thiol-disulfide oxidoreductase DCC family protein [Anoxybacillus sp. UARK-01]|uniref:thiol-disulfide oxidoreductase DCC family protein n=1 Tax=Anoxybacillus sp. UARK-01 TaxID=1895648 RepID=UPI0013747480|nr:DUF393 domain-containing protein [Anoxybacillus sp. UARK-01]